MFKTSLKCYDAVINLKGNMIPKSYQKVDSKGTKINFSSELDLHDDIPITDFDPVKLYLTELKVFVYLPCCLFLQSYQN